jgi:hypothetical protein
MNTTSQLDICKPFQSPKIKVGKNKRLLMTAEGPRQKLADLPQKSPSNQSGLVMFTIQKQLQPGFKVKK